MNYQDFYGYSGEQNSILLEEKKKTEDFYAQMKAFEDITTVEEARTLAKKLLPVKDEFTSFNIGSATCTVFDGKDNFRICINNENKFVCYDF